MVNGPIIAGTIVLNVMQEDSPLESGIIGAACTGKPGPSECYLRIDYVKSN